MASTIYLVRTSGPYVRDSIPAGPMITRDSQARFQFGTSSLLWGITWGGLWIAAWPRLAVILDPDRPGWMTRILIEGTFWGLVLCISPFAVFGMIVGRRWIGVAFGALTALLFVGAAAFTGWLIDQN